VQGVIPPCYEFSSSTVKRPPFGLPLTGSRFPTRNPNSLISPHPPLPLYGYEGNRPSLSISLQPCRFEYGGFGCCFFFPAGCRVPTGQLKVRECNRDP